MDWHRHQNHRQVRINQKGDLVYLTFPILEGIDWVSHLFSTRMGGVSEGIYRSMNLSYTRGDEKAAVDENFRRIAAVLSCGVEDIVCSDQTHTTNLRVVGRQDGGKGVTKPKDYRDVDGLLTDEPGVYLATFYADCVPLYFVDEKRRAIALAHSGWRGTAARMGRCVAEKMREVYGTNPADLTAVIGPSICQECYEISEDVAQAFAESFRGAGQADEILRKKGGGKYQLDLWKANEIVLTEAGIPAEKIQVTDLCTCHNSGYLFSHRASRGQRGNLGAFLGLNGN
ncbi:MAG: peptidoglycan editing factor PgeF [Bacteroidales bacterium]|nr:peptidoglycan editing factor PgeF [Bacteroidales bacterium]MCM1416419.1 peptidoglycan editing factor PgeF [bacterium]MCM1424050.1 peptidoglycan editing factor PgeF [bacterium]